MKSLISDNGGYKVYAEVNEYLRSNGNVELKFSTVYDHAKDPEHAEAKFKMILTPEQRKALKDLL